MAISWLAVLQSVPWSDVIRNAPKVADGARKLWKTVGRQTAEPPPPADRGAIAPTAAEMAARLASLEAEVTGLQAQMRASSELIKDLAEQNAQLIQRAETNRVRTMWLAAITVCLGLVLAGVLVAWARTSAGI